MCYDFISMFSEEQNVSSDEMVNFYKILSKVAVFYVGLNSSDHAKVTQKIDQMQVVI